MLDKYGRNIHYARLSLTDLCNLRCLYCMPQDGVEKKEHKDIITIENFVEVIDCLAELGIDKIRLTGGEPLLKKGLTTLIEYIGQKFEIKTKCLTTNGIYLPEYADILKKNGFDNINISLDSLNAETYKKITRGGDLALALKGIDSALKHFSNVKLNFVAMKGINDSELQDILEFCKARDIKLRFIELMPFTYQKDFFDKHFVSLDEVKNTLSEKYNTEEDKTVDKEKIVKFDGYDVGFIMPLSHSFCNSCNRIRILSDGRLLNCLHGQKYCSFKEYLGNHKILLEYLKSSIYEKQKENEIRVGVYQKRPMNDIGG